MSFIDDIAVGGIIPEQHHDPSVPIELRSVRFGARCVVNPAAGGSRDRHGRYQLDPNVSVGDVLITFGWPVDRSKRTVPGWAHAWPVVAVNDPSTISTAAPCSCGKAAKEMYLPVRDEVYSKDDRFKALEFHLPKRSPSGGAPVPVWNKPPRDSFGIALSATEEYRQVNLFLPTDPRLFAVNRAGDPEMGTIVADVNEKFEVDLIRCARLQSMMHVVRPKKACIPLPQDSSITRGNAIAWNLDVSSCDAAWGHGICIDRPGPATKCDVPVNIVTDPADRPCPKGHVVGLCSQRVSGPLEVGGPACQHHIGQTKDGEPIKSMHLSTNSYFLGHGGDAPLEFLNKKYPDVFRPPFPVPVELTLDEKASHPFVCGERKCLWRWNSWCFFYRSDSPIPTPGTPPPGQPPPESPPPKVPTPRTPPPEGPRPPLIPTGDPRFPRIQPWKPEFGPQPFTATTAEVAVPAILFRPQSTRSDSVDLRRAGEIPAELLTQHDQTAPVTLRIEAFAEQQANGFGRYTQSPGQSRFVGGTANGGIVLLPPEVDITDQGTDFAPSGITRSTSYVAIGPNVFFFSGKIDLSTGSPAANGGIRWGAGTAPADLRFSAIRDGGAIDPVMDLVFSGGNVKAFYNFELLKGGSVLWVTSDNQIRVDDMPRWFLANNVMTFSTFNGPWVFMTSQGFAIEHSFSGSLGGQTVFNEQARNSDFRIEGTLEANLFFVDADTNRIGIGTGLPDVDVDVRKEILSVGSTTGRFRWRGVHSANPADPPAGSSDAFIFDDGVTKAFRVRYNDRGVIKTFSGLLS